MLKAIFVEKLMEGKVLSAELDLEDKSSFASEKSLSVAELDQAISDVHKILEVVSEQVSVKCHLSFIRTWYVHLCKSDNMAHSTEKDRQTDRTNERNISHYAVLIM